MEGGEAERVERAVLVHGHSEAEDEADGHEDGEQQLERDEDGLEEEGDDEEAEAECHGEHPWQPRGRVLLGGDLRDNRVEDREGETSGGRLALGRVQSVVDVVYQGDGARGEGVEARSESEDGRRCCEIVGGVQRTIGRAGDVGELAQRVEV